MVSQVRSHSARVVLDAKQESHVSDLPRHPDICSHMFQDVTAPQSLHKCRTMNLCSLLNQGLEAAQPGVELINSCINLSFFDLLKSSLKCREVLPT